MKSLEANVGADSEYFINTPSDAAKRVFLYPTHLGRFAYLPGYCQRRARFDSFLLMYVRGGTLTLEYQGKTVRAGRDSFVLIDCYQPHAYYSDAGWEALWIHFDGIAARGMYEMAAARLGNVFTMENTPAIVSRMNRIYEVFSEKQPVRDAELSRWLNDILTDLILYTPEQVPRAQRASSVEDAKAYIQEHFREEVSVADLAEVAVMSPCHFIRVFKSETGFTPHDYLVDFRIHVARYLLESTALPVSSVCAETGFSSSSVFCAAFRRKTGQTPSEYRKGHQF